MGEVGLCRADWRTQPTATLCRFDRLVGVLRTPAEVLDVEGCAVTFHRPPGWNQGVERYWGPPAEARTRDGRQRRPTSEPSARPRQPQGSSHAVWRIGGTGACYVDAIPDVVPFSAVPCCGGGGFSEEGGGTSSGGGSPSDTVVQVGS